ncbi:MAG: SDR family oxidoreductase [Gammaproteobacteria bacterium]|nr:SDR family oxidoreductase [Gammaproteobacteria bacterium]
METTKKTNQTVLITGASWGFGYELAKKFAEDGYNLVLVARSEDRLNEIATDFKSKYGIKIFVLVKDLFSPSAPDEIHQQMLDNTIQIDILVNNAGVGTYGQFSEIETQKDLNLVQLNVVVVTHMTKLFLKDMIARKQGKILNVASMAAYLPGPYMATYFASKSYVKSFTESVNEEVKGSGVSLMALCPGVAATKFQETAENKNALIGGAKGTKFMSAEEVIEGAYADFKKGKSLSTPGASTKVMSYIVPFLPTSLMLKFVKKFNSSPDIKPY